MDAVATAAPAPRGGRIARLRAAYGQELVVLGSILALMAISGAVNSRFLSDTNLTSVFSGNAYVAVAAIGMSMVIIAGHIDVSVGSLIGVLAIIAGTLAVRGHPVWLAWLAAVVGGIAIEAVNGVLVAYARIPAIVVTLGMLSILKGGLISATQGAWITNLPPDFLLAQFRLLGIPSPVWFAAFLTVLAALWMRYTALGRSIYAVGGNAESARRAGIQVAGGLAGPAFYQPAAALAAVLFGAIGSSLIFLNVSAYWLKAVLGLLILATVLADMARRRRAS